VEKTEDGGAFTETGNETLPLTKEGSDTNPSASGVPLPEPQEMSKQVQHPKRAKVKMFNKDRRVKRFLIITMRVLQAPVKNKNCCTKSKKL
jgi:hypothetical protein